MSRSTTHLVMDSGAHIIRREGRKIKHNRAKTIIGEKFIRQTYLYFEPIPEKFRL
jgi:hypothetical protein